MYTKDLIRLSTQGIEEILVGCSINQQQILISSAARKSEKVEFRNGKAF